MTFLRCLFIRAAEMLMQRLETDALSGTSLSGERDDK
jgi:hypothetical protein